MLTGILLVADGLPVTIRLLDAPRHAIMDGPVALTAADLAAHTGFLSIGSNNLTQFMLAVSRDDAEAGFLGSYVHDQVIAANPFERLDLVYAATATAGPVQRRSRRTHALDGLAGLSGLAQLSRSAASLLLTAAMAGGASMRGNWSATTGSCGWEPAGRSRAASRILRDFGRRYALRLSASEQG